MKVRSEYSLNKQESIRNLKFCGEKYITFASERHYLSLLANTHWNIYLILMDIYLAILPWVIWTAWYTVCHLALLSVCSRHNCWIVFHWFKHTDLLKYEPAFRQSSYCLFLSKACDNALGFNKVSCIRSKCKNVFV